MSASTDKNKKSDEHSDVSSLIEDESKLDASQQDSESGTIGPQIAEGKRSQRKHFPGHGQTMESTSDPAEEQSDMPSKDDEENKLDMSTAIKAAGTIGYAIGPDILSQKQHFPDQTNMESTNGKSEEQSDMPSKDDEENNLDLSTAIAGAGTIGYSVGPDIRTQRKHFPDKTRSTIFNY